MELLELAKNLLRIQKKNAIIKLIILNVLIAWGLTIGFYQFNAKSLLYEMPASAVAIDYSNLITALHNDFHYFQLDKELTNHQSDIARTIYNNQDNFNLELLNKNKSIITDKGKKSQIIVNVTNNGNYDTNGTITIEINDINKFNDFNGSQFVNKTNNGLPVFDLPVNKTLIRIFEFDSQDVPIGKEFSAVLSYDDDYQERANGIRSQQLGPEELQIYLSNPCSNNQSNSESQFHLDTQVINNGQIDQEGSVYVAINNTNIKDSHHVNFPRNESITIPFECNSDYIPFGKGYTIKLESRDGNVTSERIKSGINDATKVPEMMNFTLVPVKKFLVNVQISNNGSHDEYGRIHISTEDGTLSKYTSTTFDLPANETVTKTFEFDSQDVPVGKKMMINLSGSFGNLPNKSIIKSPNSGLDTVKFQIE